MISGQDEIKKRVDFWNSVQDEFKIEIYANSPNKIGIGCKVYDLDYWLSNYENIGLHSSYSNEQIQEYGRYLKFISDNRDLVFKCFVVEGGE